MKRQPTLADRLLVGQQVLNPKADEAAVERLRLAKRFVVDRQAASYIGEMIRRVPRIIADAQDFAIPPFENMWIEFPYDAFFEAITQLPADVAWTATGRAMELGQGEFDTHMGFLISGSHHVRVAVWGPGKKGSSLPIWTPVEYLLHRPWTREEELKFRQEHMMTGLTLDHFFWGSSADELSAGGKESVRALRAEHSVRTITPDSRTHKEMSPELWNIVLSQSNGDLRNIIAVLLFLNRTSDFQVIRDVPTTQGFIGNKVRPYLKHSVITLRVDRDEVEKRILRLYAGHGATRALHDVRGHFCHNERAKTAECMHDWEETDYMPNQIVSGSRVPRQWRCLRCTGLRWWRKEHERGHEEVGLVSSEYNVIKG
jgi:hypothetical protein